ncbi:hypothetical protein TKK_0003438 [Trichogramma kaykai]
MRKAALPFNKPSATLSRKNKNPQSLEKKPGTGPVLGVETEAKIAQWIKHRAQNGFPGTKNQVLDAVDLYVKAEKLPNPFTEDRPGRHWFEAFKKHQGGLTICKAQQFSHTRAEVTQEDLEEWFVSVEKFLTSKDIMHLDPSRVFNCDETSLAICPKGEDVLAVKGARAVYSICDADKACFTVLFMYSAAGVRAPLMVMYNLQKVPNSVVQNSPEGWATGLSENGWMTTESFYECITNIFYPWLLQEQIQLPVILYADNHSSYLNIPLISFCEERGIEMIGLVPNSTHIMQPLDISFFKAFKDSWRKSVPKFKKLTIYQN